MALMRWEEEQGSIVIQLLRLQPASGAVEWPDMNGAGVANDPIWFRIDDAEYDPVAVPA